MKQHLFAAITELNGECEYTTSILVCCDKDADLNELADTIASDWRGEAEFCEQEGVYMGADGCAVALPELRPVTDEEAQVMGKYLLTLGY